MFKWRHIANGKYSQRCLYETQLNVDKTMQGEDRLIEDYNVVLMHLPKDRKAFIQCKITLKCLLWPI